MTNSERLSPLRQVATMLCLKVDGRVSENVTRTDPQETVSQSRTWIRREGSLLLLIQVPRDLLVPGPGPAKVVVHPSKAMEQILYHKLQSPSAKHERRKSLGVCQSMPPRGASSFFEGLPRQEALDRQMGPAHRGGCVNSPATLSPCAKARGMPCGALVTAFKFGLPQAMGICQSISLLFWSRFLNDLLLQGSHRG